MGVESDSKNDTTKMLLEVKKRLYSSAEYTQQNLHNYESLRNIHYQILKNKMQERQTYCDRTLNDSQGIVFKYLKRQLGHFAGSPKIGTANAYKKTYVFHGEGEPTHEEEMDNVVNYSKETAYNFAQMLVANAKNARETYKINRTQLGQREYLDTATQRLENVEDRFVLVADKGTGKTTFVNYLISVVGSDESDRGFDKNNTIFVRLDINKQENISLKEWIEYKICRISYRYYREHAEKSHGRSLQFNLSEDNSSLMRYYFQYYKPNASNEITFRLFENELKKASEPNEYQPFSISRECFNTLYNYLIDEKEINFIIVVDGLDKLSLDKDKVNYFEDKIKELQTLFQEHNSIGAMLAVCRTETYEKKLRGFSFNRTPKLFFIEPVKPCKIYASKRDYLTDPGVIESQDELVRALGAKDLQTASELLKIICNYFVVYIYKSLLSDFFKPDKQVLSKKEVEMSDDLCVRVCFGYARKLFGTDNRKIFQCLATIINFFIFYYDDSLAVDITDCADDNKFKNKLKRRRYLVAEALLLGKDRTVYHSNYTYSFDKNSKLLRASEEKSPTFIGNIFNYPSIVSEELPNQHMILTGIRILQFLKLEVVSTENKIIEFIHNHFKYEKLLIDCRIDELKIYGFIKINDDGNVIINELGDFILSSFIYNPTYLNFATQSTPLPKDLVTDNESFSVKYVDDPEFAAYLIVNCINFVKHLRHVEEIEERLFIENRSPYEREKGYTLQNYNGFSFLVTKDIRHSDINNSHIYTNIRNTAEGIIYQAAKMPDSDLCKRLKKIFLN